MAFARSLFSNVILESLITLWYGNITITLCLIISIFSCTKIFLTLRHHQNQVQDHVHQPNPTNQLNMARYKKAVSTAIWLVACYLPHGIVDVFMTTGGLSASLFNARIYTNLLIY